MEPKVKSLYKALKLLEYFGEEHKTVGVTELAEHSNLPKSSVHNILQTFESCGYVIQDYNTQKYMLGSTAVSLFSKFKASRNLDYRITEYLQRLKEDFHANICLGEKQGYEAIYLYAEMAIFTDNNYLSKAGARVPLHCTPIGKVLLAYSTVDEKNEFYRQPLIKYTENTIVDLEELKQEMDNIIYQGYAISDYEHMNNMYGVAVPIITGDGPVKYAISLCCEEDISEYMIKKYIKELRMVAEKIAGILVEAK